MKHEGSSRVCVFRTLLFGCFAAFAPTTAFSALEKTAEECTKLYGRAEANQTYEVTPPARIKYFYTWQGFQVAAQLVGRDASDSRCGYVTYRRLDKPTLKFQIMTEPEIERLLALNANGKSWEKVAGGWKRSDNRALAVELKAMVNNVLDRNELVIFSADFYPNESKQFAEVRASLSKQLTK